MTVGSLTTIRSWEGSQHRAFEELSYQLYRRDVPEGTKAIRTGNPDGGVEWYVTLSNGDEWGWQAKYVSSIDSLLSGMTESVKTVARERPNLMKLTFVISMNLSSGTYGGKKKSGYQKYEDKKASWARTIPGADRIQFCIIQESDLLARLASPSHIGRREFWWDDTQLDGEWFKRFHERQTKLAGERYSPSLNVDVSILNDIVALRGTSWIDREFNQQAEQFIHFMPVFSIAENIISSDLANELIDLNANIKEVSELLDTIDTLRDHVERIPLLLSTLERLLTMLASIKSGVSILSADQKESGQGTYSAENSRQIDSLYYGVLNLDARIRTFRSWFHESKFLSFEKRAYFVEGPAGIGKTHLLLESVSNALDDGDFALALFGDRFSDDIWESLCQQVGLPSLGRDKFLGMLEAAAETRDGRLLIVVDAINETATKDYWSRYLQEFLIDIQEYPSIALVVSCRDTYLDWTDPYNHRTLYVVQQHPGFHGVEVEATHIYFKHYNLEIPRIPLLTPDFSNPMFLRIYCEAAQSNTSGDWTSGYKGRIEIFRKYLEVKLTRIQRRLYSEPQSPILFKHDRNQFDLALVGITNALAMSGFTGVEPTQLTNEISELTGLSGNTVSGLLNGLIFEGVLSEGWSFDRTDNQPTVRFTFQAFSDYMVLDSKVQQFTHPLEDGVFIQWLIEEALPGTLEVASVYLPERFGVELLDIIGSTGSTSNPRRPGFKNEFVYNAFLRGLPYRQASSITNDTIRCLKNAIEVGIDATEFYDIMFMIAPQPDNLLNADGLHQHLSRFSMARRDAQFGIATYRGLDVQNSPISRLARWASDGPYPDYPDKIIELSATAMMWLLSSANRPMRDWVTKALVQLLHGHLKVAEIVLNRFWSVNDPYVRQRMLVVTYGSLLRCDIDEQTNEAADLVRTVAQFLGESHICEDEIFIDTCRALIEWGIAHEFLPPSERDMVTRPFGFPTLGSPLKEESIKQKYDLKFRSTQHEDYSTVYSSLLGFSDFGRYVVDSSLYQFTKLRKGGDQSKVEEIDGRISKSSLRRFENIPANEQERLPFSGEVSIDTFDDESLSPDQRSALGNVEENPKPTPDIGFHFSRARRWIFQRVLSLGWTPELFGNEDYWISRSDQGRGEHKAERWGKKYQWIAYHQLMARLYDNYQTRSHYDDRGPRWEPDHWRFELRDIDPSVPPVKYRDFLKRNEDGVSWQSSSLGLPTQVSPSVDFSKYEGDVKQFLSSRTDEPLAKRSSVHTAGVSSWIALSSYETQTEQIGISKTSRLSQMVWHDSWFVPLSSALRSANMVLGLKRGNRPYWEPDYEGMERGVYWRETDWLPLDIQSSDNGWYSVEYNETSKVTLAPTNFTYLWEGNMLDCSIEAAVSANIPSRFILHNSAPLRPDDSAGWRDTSGQVVFQSAASAPRSWSGTEVFWADKRWIQEFMMKSESALVLVTQSERLSHELVMSTSDDRLVTVSAAILYPDGELQQLDRVYRSPWPPEKGTWRPDK